MSVLSIAYMTNRREPHFEWFAQSFHRECGGDYSGLKMICVDFWADTIPGRRERFQALCGMPLTHIVPKPTVWQGPHRLTSVDYFAAANARNTALCVAPDGYLVFVDDLSVLMPGWLNEVRRAMAHNYVACGSYEKVLDLVVENGQVMSFTEHEPGKDARAKTYDGQEPFRCGGSWAFGASIGMPVEMLLSVNGYDEDNDSQGGEDYICGIMLEKNGFELRYCPRMKTLESEELHFVEPPFKRIIKEGPTAAEIDASHRILNMVQKGGRHRAPNYANMRELRQKVLFENQPWPVSQIPANDWRDGQPLASM